MGPTVCLWTKVVGSHVGYLHGPHVRAHMGPMLAWRVEGVASLHLRLRALQLPDRQTLYKHEMDPLDALL